MGPVVTARAYITVQASSNARLSGLGGSLTLYIGARIASLERIPPEVECLASDLIELSTRYNCAFWLPGVALHLNRRHTLEGIPRFKCSSFYELNAVNTLPVHDLSAVNDYILRFKYSSTIGHESVQAGLGRSSSEVDTSRRQVVQAPQPKKRGE